MSWHWVEKCKNRSAKQDCIICGEIHPRLRWGMAFFGALVAILVPFYNAGLMNEIYSGITPGKEVEVWFGVFLGSVGLGVSTVVVGISKLPNLQSYFLGAVALPAVLLGGLGLFY